VISDDSSAAELSPAETPAAELSRNAAAEDNPGRTDLADGR
jgi:hypothetical protein